MIPSAVFHHSNNQFALRESKEALLYNNLGKEFIITTTVVMIAAIA
jgi:hypothetical protein